MDNTVGSQQRDIIIGTLLGDGFFERNGRYVRLIIDHSTKQLPYLQYKYEQLKSFGGKIVFKEQFDIRTGKLYHHCAYRTPTSPLFEEYHIIFYKGRRKGVPKGLSKIITPQMLAIWIMDDGYRRNDCNALRLNTQSYSYEEHASIQKALQTLGIESGIQKHKASFVTYIPSRSMERLRSTIRPYIIPSMEYKIA